MWAVGIRGQKTSSGVLKRSQEGWEAGDWARAHLFCSCYAFPSKNGVAVVEGTCVSGTAHCSHCRTHCPHSATALPCAFIAPHLSSTHRPTSFPANLSSAPSLALSPPRCLMHCAPIDAPLPCPLCSLSQSQEKAPLSQALHHPHSLFFPIPPAPAPAPPPHPHPLPHALCLCLSLTHMLCLPSPTCCALPSPHAG